MKSLESAEDMCKRLLQNDAFCLPHPECCPSNTFKSVTCLNCEVLQSINEMLKFQDDNQIYLFRLNIVLHRVDREH